MTREEMALLKCIAEIDRSPAVRRAVTAALIELGLPMPPVRLSELERSLEEKHEEWLNFLGRGEKRVRSESDPKR
jgi:hypothetical protein